MSTKTNYYLIFSEPDKQIAFELVQKLEELHVFTSPATELMKPGYLNTVGKDAVYIVLFSDKSTFDKTFQFHINYAIENHLVLILVQVNPCSLPGVLQNMMPFDYQYLFSTQKERFFKMAGISPFKNLSKNVAIDDHPVQSYPPNIVESAPGKSIFKSFIESINPFQKKKQKSFFDDLDNMVGSSIGSVGSSSKRAYPTPAPEQTPAEAKPPAPPASFESNKSTNTRHSPADTRYGSTLAGGNAVPDLSNDESTPAEPQAELLRETPGKGKVLYDIPESMTVNVQHACLVRVGKNEAIVLDDDRFSADVKIVTIPISKVMEVDMVDVSDQPRFTIKKISSVEQLVDDDSYSEWIFIVTPLTGGVYPLLLKVSVIKIIDGKERRKELVYTQSVNIAAAANSPSLIMPLVSQVAANANRPQLKELMKDKDVKELDPPSVFISYAHNDKTYFDIFNQYLETHSGWNIWTDRNIEIGSGWFAAIQSSIKDSDIAVLLISANFISSGFIKEHEYHQFSSLESTKPAFKFLPILLRDVDFARWEDLAAMQLFVAYGDDYGVPEKTGVMIPFAKLCRFDNNGQLIPNDNIDTYFKNLVKKAEKDWLISKR